MTTAVPPRALWVLAAIACAPNPPATKPGPAPVRTRAVPAPVSSTPATATTGAPMPAVSDRAPELDVAGVASTSAGGAVLAVGQPRFQVIQEHRFRHFVLRAQRGLVFAMDAEFVTIWNASTGIVVRRIPPAIPHSFAFTALAVSEDGEWLADDAELGVRLFRAPFETPVAELRGCVSAEAFSHHSQLLACGAPPDVWDLTTRRRVAARPKTTSFAARSVRFTPDDRSLVWLTRDALVRWDFAGDGAVHEIVQAPAMHIRSEIAEAGTAAYIERNGKQAVVDLTTGKPTSVPTGFTWNLSPSGRRLAHGAPPPTLNVLDVATAKPIWTTRYAEFPKEVIFGETDDTLAYVESGRIRIAKLPAAPLPLPVTSRFAGWIGPSVAAIRRGDSLRSYQLSTRTWGAADAAALALRRPRHAPPWAQWVSAPGAGDDDLVLAEPNKRHELAPAERFRAPCTPSLRVWTPRGGIQSLIMPCRDPEPDDHDAPGWEIGGGWVISVSQTLATLYDARTGQRVHEFPLPPSRSPNLDLAETYWHMALSPDGNWLALVWRFGVPGRAPTTDDAGGEDDQEVPCEHSAKLGCEYKYVVGLWHLHPPLGRIWLAPLTRSVSKYLPDQPAPLTALAFDPTGSNLVMGFDDGELRIVPTGHPDAVRSERLHIAPIERIAVDPAGAWVATQDAAGEHRVWQLTNR